MKDTLKRIEKAVRIDAGTAHLDGDLAMPAEPHGIVIFAHGSGSSRFSPRNRFVAEELNAADIGTLLIDLLTRAEESVDVQTAELRFDIDLLAERLVAATDWVRSQQDLQTHPIGYFGASTGGGAALVADTMRPEEISAIVSRGGRPDLAGAALPAVRAPTLLIVGGADETVIALNEHARAQMKAPVRLEIVPGATHLFEEPGALSRVAELARNWFVEHFRS